LMVVDLLAHGFVHMNCFSAFWLFEL
jgi:hypothetical protein